MVTAGLFEMIDAYLADESKGAVSYASSAEPIKLGYLFDFVLPEGYPKEKRDDLKDTFELVFDDGLQRGSSIDRSRSSSAKSGVAEGDGEGGDRRLRRARRRRLPRGVRTGDHRQLRADEGSDRTRFHVPAISVTGAEDWLGEWTFSLSMGSMTDEPIFWAHLLARDGHREVGVLVEQSLVGQSYAKAFRSACRAEGIRIVAEESIPQTGQDIGNAMRALYAAKVPALVHCGFGFGIVFINPALQERGWDPPRYLGTAFQNAWLHR
jgi:hypothetical protein